MGMRMAVPEPAAGGVVGRVTALILVMVLCGLAALPARADVVSLRSDLWCPYNCDPDSDHPGYVIEIARTIFAQAGHRVDYHLLSWPRTLEGVRRGLFSGAVGATMTDGRDLVFGREPVGMQVNALALRTDRLKSGAAFHYTGVESLRQLRLGVAMGYTYDNGPIDAYLRQDEEAPTGRVLVARGDDVVAANLRRLMSGHIDAALDSAAVLSQTITEMGLQGDVMVLEIGTPVPVYIAFSPVDPRAAGYVGLLDAGIARLRSGGELAAILARYGVEDWAVRPGTGGPAKMEDHPRGSSSPPGH